MISVQRPTKERMIRYQLELSMKYGKKMSLESVINYVFDKLGIPSYEND